VTFHWQLKVERGKKMKCAGICPFEMQVYGLPTLGNPSTIVRPSRKGTTREDLSLLPPTDTTLFENNTPSSDSFNSSQPLTNCLPWCVFALLINHSLLSSYPLWFFCWSQSSILILDTVPKEPRNIWNTPYH
jgi:hypothetical protein